MSEDLSSDELGALLGDDAGIMVGESTSPSGGGTLGALQSTLTNSLPEIRQSLSQGLGEEIDLNLANIELTSGIGVEGASAWYVAKGSMTKGSASEQQFLVIPSNIAKQMVIQYSGVEDIEENDAGQIADPLHEFLQTFVSKIASAFGSDLSASLDDFEFSNTPEQASDDIALIKIVWTLGGNNFYYFLENSILQTLNGSIQNADANAGSTSADLVQFGDLIDESANISGETNSQGGSLFGNMESSDSDSLSLGDALLGGGVISDVSMPEFDDYSQKGDKNSNSMKMLMDVALDVTVELGKTKKLVGDVLELNRGSIIELKKLAGEPLDIKVNNKLVARGEVVVIDEYFGVRVIEIVSPYEKPKPNS